MALEYQQPLVDGSTRWDRIWSELDDEDEDEDERPEVEVFDTHSIWFFDITHEEYVNDIKRKFNTNEDQLTVRCRFLFKDSNNNPIAGLGSEFDVTIVDNGEVNEDCQDA